MRAPEVLEGPFVTQALQNSALATGVGLPSGLARVKEVKPLCLIYQSQLRLAACDAALHRGDCTSSAGRRNEAEECRYRLCLSCGPAACSLHAMREA